MGVVTLRIEQATADDADGLAELAAVTFPLACPQSSRPEDIEHYIATELSPAKFLHHLADPARTLLCVRDGASLAAYSLLVQGEPTDVRSSLSFFPTIELSKFYVHPDHHGRGASSSLMQANLNAAAGNGAKGIWLGTNDENHRAVRFYEKHGFAKVGVKTFRLGAGIENDFILERALSDC